MRSSPPVWRTVVYFCSARRQITSSSFSSRMPSRWRTARCVRALRRRRRPAALRQPPRALRGGREFLLAHGLQQVAHGLGLEGLHGVLVVGGGEDDRGRIVERGQVPRQLQARHARHAHVEVEQVRLERRAAGAAPRRHCAPRPPPPPGPVRSAAQCSRARAGCSSSTTSARSFMAAAPAASSMTGKRSSHHEFIALAARASPAPLRHTAARDVRGCCRARCRGRRGVPPRPAAADCARAAG